jgi:hypothetical protein
MLIYPKLRGDIILSAVSNTVNAVCDPLRAMGFECAQPFIVFRLGHLLLLVAIFAIVTLILRVTLFRKPVSRGYSTSVQLSFERNPHNDSRILYMDPYSLAQALGRPTHHLKTKLEKNLNQDRLNQWYVVEIHENGKRLLRREMRVRARARGYAQGDASLDQSLIEIIRAKNESVEDDDFEGGGVEGCYDVTFRKVKWYDLGHWLTHPNRDIRLGLWVAIIATTIEYSDKLFGLLSGIWKAF